MSSSQDSHDFPYAPVVAWLPDDDGEGTDIVVATSEVVDPSTISRALEGAWGSASAETLIAHAPLFWARVRTSKPCVRAEVEQALRTAGVPVRYVASAQRQSMALPPPLDVSRATSFRPSTWREAPAHETPVDPVSDGRWFLREGLGGVAVDRERCGTGTGTRLAVIDDDAADFEQLDLEATVLVGIGRPSSASGHGAMLIGWAVGARTYEGSRFWGVAPSASVRAYLIPRPGDEVVFLPLALARAAIDGADVIVCATWIDVMTSPMLDDALELATRLGRGGLGCAVVFPSGRETSSPKRLHPREPVAVAWCPRERPSRVLRRAGRTARGMVSLARAARAAASVFQPRAGGEAPRARRRSDTPVSRQGAPVPCGIERSVLGGSGCAPACPVQQPILARRGCIRTAPAVRGGTDAYFVGDLRRPRRPRGRIACSDATRTAHDAKHGYGRIHALRACIAARDPIALELIGMGEDAAARAWADARRGGGAAENGYSSSFAQWAVGALLADAATEHAIRVVLRHMRLLSKDVRRRSSQPQGAIARQLALALRAIARRTVDAPAPVRAELSCLQHAAISASGSAAAFEAALCELAERVFAREAGRRRRRAPLTSALRTSRHSARPRDVAPGARVPCGARRR